MSEVKDILNPLRELRLLTGRTQVYVAGKLDLSNQYIMRCEQGMYAQMDAQVYWWLVNDLMWFDKDIPAHLSTWIKAADTYHSYQQQQREVAAQRLKGWWLISDVVPGDMSEHPLVTLRLASRYSRVGFAKAFCVSQSLVERWESRSHMVVEVPPVILDALFRGGVSKEHLDLLQKAYAEHREFKRTQVTHNSSNENTSKETANING